MLGTKRKKNKEKDQWKNRRINTPETGPRPPLTDNKVVLLQELAAGVVVVVGSLTHQRNDQYSEQGQRDGAEQTHVGAHIIHLFFFLSRLGRRVWL